MGELADRLIYRNSRVRLLGVALSLIPVAAGCDPFKDPTPAPDPTPKILCYFQQQLNIDNDCDGIINAYDQHPGQNDWNFDSDHDSIADPIDRFPNGYDFSDFDSDGIANWADLNPYNVHSTIAAMIGATPQQAVQYGRQALTTEAHVDQNKVTNLMIINQQLDFEARDSDYDNIPNIYDAEPDLNYNDDQDNDGISNGHDYFPEDASSH